MKTGSNSTRVQRGLTLFQPCHILTVVSWVHWGKKLMVSALLFLLLGFSFKAKRATKLLDSIMLVLNLQRGTSFILQMSSILEYVPTGNFITYIYVVREQCLYSVEKLFCEVSARVLLHHPLKLFRLPSRPPRPNAHTHKHTQTHNHSEYS